MVNFKFEAASSVCMSQLKPKAQRFFETILVLEVEDG